MTATVGLERLPRSVAAPVDEAADNLVAIANALDESVYGDVVALAVGNDRAREGDRMLHDLVEAVRASRRIGPRRAQLVLLGHAIDAVVDKVDELAGWWSASPVPALTDVVLAVRDAARDGGQAVKALEDPARLRDALDRLHDDADELRGLERAAGRDCSSTRRTLSSPFAAIACSHPSVRHGAPASASAIA